MDDEKQMEERMARDVAEGIDALLAPDGFLVWFDGIRRDGAWLAPVVRSPGTAILVDSSKSVQVMAADRRFAKAPERRPLGGKGAAAVETSVITSSPLPPRI